MFDFKFTYLIFAFFLLIGCEDRKNESNISYLQTDSAERTKKLQINSLVRAVQSAIIPSYQDWVLYEHGTYIIIDQIDSVDNVVTHCNGLLKKHTIQLTDDTKSYSITELTQVQGWSVFGKGYGIYTYVNPTSIKDDPSMSEIVNNAVYNRSKDQEALKIICISSKNGLNMLMD